MTTRRITVSPNYNVSENNINIFVKNPLDIQIQKINITLNQLNEFVEEYTGLPLNENETINLEIVKESIKNIKQLKAKLLSLNKKMKNTTLKSRSPSKSKSLSKSRSPSKSRSSSRAAEEVSSSKSKSRKILRNPFKRKSTRGGKNNKTQKRKRI